jgi:hypothetical protein
MGPGLKVTGGLGGAPGVLRVLLLVVRIGMHCTSTKNLFPGWHACTASSVVPMCVGGAVRGSRVVCQWSLRRWLPSLAVFRDHGGVVFVVMGRPHGTGNSKRSFGGKVGPEYVHRPSSVPLPGLHLMCSSSRKRGQLFARVFKTITVVKRGHCNASSYGLFLQQHLVAAYLRGNGTRHCSQPQRYPLPHTPPTTTQP